MDEKKQEEKKVVLPRKPGRCPAIPICEHLGNLRKDCVKEKPNSFFGTKDIEPCLASVVILLGANVGITIESTPPKNKNSQ